VGQREFKPMTNEYLQLLPKFFVRFIRESGPFWSILVVWELLFFLAAGIEMAVRYSYGCFFVFSICGLFLNQLQYAAAPKPKMQQPA
jgi:hypothetical protein